jgi:hypothetical protein
MVDAAYVAAVKETFETKPLRTVLMIDDEFPTLADLAEGETDLNRKKFAQKDRAVALYEAFRKNHMICDIENVVSDVQTDRFRKSDLIILDYHLGPAGGNETAIRLLRELSGSKHFNTIVVHSAEPDQNKIWLDIMASLSGGWSDYPATLTGEAQEHWERLSDDDALPSPSLDAVLEFAQRRSIRDISKPTREAAQKELVDLGVPPKVCGDLITALIQREMAHRAGNYATEPRRRAVGGYRNGQRWIQLANAFVAIRQKTELTDDDHDPGGLMTCLRAALLDWRPNLIQILTSEIQNILELEALTTEDDHLRDPVTQTALWYYLLNSLGPIDLTAPPDIRVPLISLIDKIVDGVRRRLSTDPDLLSFAGNALLGELKDAGWTDETWPKPGKSELIKKSSEIARTSDVTGPEILFRLNSFFSTERFRRAHITTGTIFYHAATDSYFAAASPACDLVARRPGVDQAWAHAIYPLTPFIAILLHPTEENSALAEAERGLNLFLESTKQRQVFKLLNPSSQPSYEFFFAKNEGRVHQDAGKTLFSAARLRPKKEAPTEQELIYDEFEIVDQLRGVNATRVLQLASQHLSRIGLDFISMPTK